MGLLDISEDKGREIRRSGVRSKGIGQYRYHEAWAAVSEYLCPAYLLDHPTHTLTHSRYLVLSNTWIPTGVSELLAALFACSLIETASKVLVKGFYRLRKSYRNSFDCAVTVLLFVCLLGKSATNYKSSHQTFVFGVRAIVLVRLALFPRNLVAAKRFSSYRRKYRKVSEILNCS